MRVYGNNGNVINQVKIWRGHSTWRTLHAVPPTAIMQRVSRPRRGS